MRLMLLQHRLVEILRYKRQAARYGIVVSCIACLISLLLAPFASAATPSSWSPTLLVNTEAFMTIDDRDSSANIVLRFGQTLEKTLTYDRGAGVFRFNDDVYVQGTMSGTTVHAGSQLRSSGTLITESGAYFDGTTMVVNANNNRVGFGTATPRGVFLHVGSSGTSADSNAAVYVNDGGTSSTFFQIRTASNRGDNFAVTNAGNVGVQTTTPGSQFSVSGAVIINPRGNLGSGAADAGVGLEVIGTVSGSTIFANQSLRSSGSLVFEGAASGSSLFLGTSLKGAGLTDCDTGATSKLLWDSTTGRFSCGTDQTGGGSSFGSGNVLTIGDGRYVNVSGDTMTGALRINNRNAMGGTGALWLSTQGGQHILFGSGGTNYDVGLKRISTGSLMLSGSLVINAKGSGAALKEARLAVDGLQIGQLEGGLVFGRTTVRERILDLRDYGTTWTARDSSRNWRAIAMSSDGKAQTAVVYGGQIYTSLDYGATWTARDSNRDWRAVAISADGKVQTATVDSGQIYTSSDYGATWTARDSSRSWYSVAMSSDGKMQTAGAYGGQIYTSSDYGATWTARDSSRSWYSVAMSSDGKVQTAVVVSGQIYTSNNYGATWTARASSRGWSFVAMSSDGKVQTAVVSGGQIYTSLDYGATWTARDSSRNWYSVAMSSDGKMQTAVAYGGQIYTSSDYGATWTARDSSRNWITVAMSSDGKVQTGGELGGQIYVSHATATIPGGLFNVSGTMSGTIVQAQTTLASSGSLVFEGAASGSSLFLGTSLKGAGLTDCDTGATSKLLWDSTTGRFSCGTDQTGGGSSSFGSGNVITIGDGRYVNVSGDTMTGALRINNRNAMGGTGALWLSTQGGQHILFGSGGTNYDVGLKRISTGSLMLSGSLIIGSKGSGSALKEARLSVDGLQIGQLEGGLVFGRTTVHERIWDLRDHGATWTVRASSRSWTSVAMSSDGKLQTAVAQNDQIYTSSDYGATWTARGSTQAWTSVAMSADGKMQTAVAATGQIYTSSDYGVTWIARDSSRDWYSVAMSSDGKVQTAVVYGGQIYTSRDYGATWVARDSSRNWISVAMSSDGKVQTAVVYGGGQIYTSYDYGATWAARESGRHWQSIAMSSDGKVQTAVVYSGQIYTSSDYGATWTARASSTVWFSIAMSADGREQTAVIISGQIYTSSDYGATWTARDSSRNWYSVAMSSDGKVQTAVVFNGQIYVSHATATIPGGVFNVRGTMSGTIVTAKTTLASSGSLVFEGAASGSSLYLGTSLNGAGLTDCDTGATSKLLWDSTTGRFSCGTDQTGGGSSSFGSGNVITISDGRYVNVSGDTMTGGLTIQNGNTHTPTGTALLNVRGVLSGATLYANQSLRSSGSLVVEGNLVFGDAIGDAITVNAGAWTFANNTTFTMNGGAGTLEVVGTLSGSKISVNGALNIDRNGTITGATIDVRKNTIAAVTGALVWYVDGALATGTEQSIILTLPHAFTPTAVELKTKTGGHPSGQSLIIDINEGGSTIFSTRPEVDAGATVEDGNHVFSDTSLAKGAEISMDIDQVGSTKAGSGITVMLKGTFDM